LAGKFLYRDVYVIGIIHWKEDHRLIKVVSREEGKFLVLWKIPRSKKIGIEQQPELFSFIHAVIQQKSEANYSLRSFETLDSLYYNKQDLNLYLKLSFLARLTSLCDEELSGEHSAFPLWLNIQNKTLSTKIDLTEILCNFLFIHGLWFSFRYCEQCNCKLTKNIFIENGNLKCLNCTSQNSSKCDPSFLTWMQNQYTKNSNLLEGNVFKNTYEIDRELLKRLAPHLLRDTILTKLMNRWYS